MPPGRRRILWLLALSLASAARPAAAEGPQPLVVGVDEDYFPFEFRDAQGRAAGPDVELMAAAAHEAGLEVRFRPGPWGVLRRSIEDGSIDLLAGMFRTREREATIAFSSPHALVDYVVYVRAPAGAAQARPIRTLSDLQGKRVLVEEGAVVHELMQRLTVPVRLVTVRSEGVALQLVAVGQADAAVVSALGGAAAVGKLGLSGLERGEPVATFEYCFAARRDRGALVARLDAGLARLRQRGEYDRIRRRWFGLEEAHPDLHRALVLAAAAAAVLLALLAAGSVWNRSLRHQVAARTAELGHHRERLEELVAARTAELTRALDQVKRLSGLIPICASCKKVRDDRGFWTHVEQYVATHSEAEFSHGICPECERRLLAELDGRAPPVRRGG